MELAIYLFGIMSGVFGTVAATHAFQLGTANGQLDRSRGRSIPAGFVAGSGPRVTSVEDAPLRSSPAPRHPGASTAIIDRFVHSRSLTPQEAPPAPGSCLRNQSVAADRAPAGRKPEVAGRSPADRTLRTAQGPPPTAHPDRTR